LTGKYQEALNEINNSSLEFNPDFKLELEALLQAQETKSNESIYKYIDSLKEKYKDSLPPVAYNTFSSIPISTILRLYDTIGDSDGGIAYIDMCIDFFKQQDIKKYGKYKPGNADEEFLKVREAFEKDKAEGKKGRATRALIQSDYFPW